MIHARGLARTFRKRKQEVHAVVGVDLDVAPGEIVGFLGPNGAGKTTTLRMLTTLLEPTAGTATVAGCDLRTDPVGVRRRIGYVSQSGATAPEARAGEEVVDHARLYGMSTAEATERGRQLFAELDLDGLWERQPKAMSGGQRRRLDIAVGLIHVPELVFLDEPTTGLDPQARANLWEHIRGLREDRGTTVFLTTHYLDEADALCDRIMVIDHGAIVAEGTPDQLKSQVGGDVLTVTAERPDQLGEVARLVGALPGAEPPQLLADRVVGRVPHGGSALVELVRALDAAGVTVSGIESRRPSLDDVFLGLTGRSLRESGAAPAAAGAVAAR
ncbi:ATP-binding cassette domain-containing protein [Blastococcus sp. MG754426]|uniref:ATP-binding cassette domain-containing protein n=1 Tax=Blastococcus sp. MG754427 TaxID=2570318 RepID=UPI001F004EE0|nr:ATP-binding cassette domain-containing protein [Blastococcus sp. MG754427]MCF6508645.1 ATP-binding cassette domain-containing protein [Blastococcus sp. MG754426]MCF6513255.1 ATP-binding cassette domain-containing protein [Blastococcus sp. MG754427]MCF6736583.1 ATP-binding cassette domain-containing protein [Blastococcus sp. KM273129]